MNVSEIAKAIRASSALVLTSKKLKDVYKIIAVRSFVSIITKH